MATVYCRLKDFGGGGGEGTEIVFEILDQNEVIQTAFPSDLFPSQ
jgi:hypothetical protein